VDIKRVQVGVIVVLWSVAIMESSSLYVAIAKGRGFLYACDNPLYKQVKKGTVIWLKCSRLAYVIL